MKKQLVQNQLEDAFLDIQYTFQSLLLIEKSALGIISAVKGAASL